MVCIPDQFSVFQEFQREGGEAGARSAAEARGGEVSGSAGEIERKHRAGEGGGQREMRERQRERRRIGVGLNH